MNLLKTVLLAVEANPGVMSPILVEFMLRGELIGRMTEKGLDKSPFFGVAADKSGHALMEAINEGIAHGLLGRIGGFYPGLVLTSRGEAWLASSATLV
jgi:hypothetical protein